MARCELLPLLLLCEHGTVLGHSDLCGACPGDCITHAEAGDGERAETRVMARRHLCLMSLCLARSLSVAL